MYEELWHNNMKNVEEVPSRFKDTDWYTIVCSSLVGFVIVAIFVVLFNTLGYNIIQVSGSSMLPTYKDKQTLLLRNETPKDNDIIIFHPSKEWRTAAHDTARNDYFIKRIVAKGGDTLQLKNNNVYVNNHLFRSVNRYNIPDFTIQIPKGKFFVMGDNYYFSNDSLYMYKTYHKGYLVDKSQIKVTAKGSELKVND